MKTQRIVSILIVLAGFLQGCNPSETPETNLHAASKSFEAQKYQESLIYLKKALKSKPSDPEIRKRLGEVWLKLGDPNACVEQLKKAQELGMQSNKVMLSLAQCYFYKKDFEQLHALEFTGNMLEVSNQDYAILQAYKAQAALATNESSKALDLLNQAEVLLKDERMVRLSRAQWLIYEKRFEDALQILDKLTAQFPNNAQVWGLKGDLYRFQQKTSLADEAYSKALQNPANKLDQINYYLYRSLVRIYLNKLDQAQEDIKKLQMLKAQHHGLHYVNGLLALAKKDFPQAIQNFQKVLDQDENFIYTHYFIGLTHALTNNYHSARDHLIRFTRARPSHVFGQKMLGFVELQLQDYNHAKNRLEKVKDLNPKDPDLFHMLGQIYIKEGDIEQGAHYLSKAQALEPKNPEMTLKLGIAQMDLGNTFAASGAFDKVLSQIPNHKDTLLLKFINEFKVKHYPPALELAKTYALTHPKDPLGYNLQGMVYLAKNQPKEAQEAFQIALQLEPHDPNAHTHLAMLSIKERNVSQAISHYKKILERHQHALSMLRLAKIYLKESHNESEAIKLLEKATQTQPNQLTGFLTLAQIHLKNKRFDLARNTLQKVPETFKKHENYLAVQGLVYLANNDIKLAQQNWHLLVKNTQIKSKAAYELGTTLALLDKNWLNLEKYAHEYLQHFPNAHAVRLKALALWEQKKTQESLKVLSTWLAQYPQDDNSHFLYANYLLQNKNWPEAEAAYRLLLKHHVKNPILYNNLAWILREKAPLEAQEHIAKALEMKPEWKPALDTLAVINRHLKAQDGAENQA